MKVFELRGSIEECVNQALEVLRSGGVMLYPTDTLYGLGADAFSNTAVDKVYAIKERDEKKPMAMVVSDLDMAAEYVEVTEDARKLAAAFLPGPLTLVLKKKAGINTGIARGMDTIAIRMPKNVFCLELAKRFGKPFTTTSANKAGEPAQMEADEILAQLGEAAAGIDMVLDSGALLNAMPSTVVDLSGLEMKILREGALAESTIRDALKN